MRSFSHCQRFNKLLLLVDHSFTSFVSEYQVASDKHCHLDWCVPTGMTMLNKNGVFMQSRNSILWFLCGLFSADTASRSTEGMGVDSCTLLLDPLHHLPFLYTSHQNQFSHPKPHTLFSCYSHPWSSPSVPHGVTSAPLDKLSLFLGFCFWGSLFSSSPITFAFQGLT